MSSVKLLAFEIVFHLLQAEQRYVSITAHSFVSTQDVATEQRHRHMQLSAPW